MSKARKSVLAYTAVAIALGALLSFTAQAGEAVSYKIANGNSIPESLTGKAGDAENGRKVAINRKQGNCLACHTLPIPEQAFHGEVGPTLTGVANNLSEGEIRLRVANPKVLNPETIMPAYYRNTDFHRVLEKFQGKTILSAQQVEDVVAYLLTLK